MKWWILLGAASLWAAPPSRTEVGTLTDFSAVEGTATFRSEAGATTEHVILQPGDLEIAWSKLVRTTLTPTDGKWRASGVVSADPSELRQEAQIVDDLRRDTFERGRLVMRGANDLMPMMGLWDQAGRFRTKTDFLGSPLVVNFIFTSCQNARMCPASTQAMRKLAEELARRPALANVRLLTFTFDPATDTPAVLRSYAQGYGIDFKRHSFLTGRETHLKDLMRHYGILTTRSDGTILHNAATIVVSPEGRLVQRTEGAVFDHLATADFLSQLVAPVKIK